MVGEDGRRRTWEWKNVENFKRATRGGGRVELVGKSGGVCEEQAFIDASEVVYHPREKAGNPKPVNRLQFACA